MSQGGAAPPLTLGLQEYYRVCLSDFDQQVFRNLIVPDHPLRKALECIRWDDFYPGLAGYYSAHLGQPAINPVLMLKDAVRTEGERINLELMNASTWN